MPESMSEWLSVRDVFEALGLPQVAQALVSAGIHVQREWLDLTGTYPRLERRPKPQNNGTNAQAVYPLTWRGRIEAAAHAASARFNRVPARDPAQMSLFGRE